MARIMYRGARGIAQRFLGADTPHNCRVVERWAEQPPEKQPVPIERDGRTLIVWEDIPAPAFFQPAIEQRRSEPEHEPTPTPTRLAQRPSRMAHKARASAAGKEKAPPG
jgi:hypothetical protein